MIEVITDSGFTAKVDFEAVRDDFEFLELLTEYDTGRLELLPKLLKLLLGVGQDGELREHCRENGRVSTTKIATEFNQIVLKLQEASKEAKN